MNGSSKIGFFIKIVTLRGSARGSERVNAGKIHAIIFFLGRLRMCMRICVCVCVCVCVCMRMRLRLGFWKPWMCLEALEPLGFFEALGLETGGWEAEVGGALEDEDGHLEAGA